METRANYLFIGTFVLLFVLGALGFVVWLARIGLDRDVRAYDIFFEDSVSGLGLGGDVTYRGIRVGEVKELAIDPADPTRVRATVEIDGVPIREGDRAGLQLQGITGVTYINIDGATPDQALLQVEPGRTRAVIPSRPSALEAIFEGAPDLLTKASLVLDRVGELFDEENQQLITSVLTGIDLATRGLNEQQEQVGRVFAAIEASREDLISGAQTLRRTAEGLELLIAETRDTLGVARQTLGSMEQVVAEDVRATLAEYRETATSLRSSFETVETLLSANQDSLQSFASQGLGELTALLAESRLLVARLAQLAERLGNEGTGALIEPAARGLEVKR